MLLLANDYELLAKRAERRAFGLAQSGRTLSGIADGLNVRDAAS